MINWIKSLFSSRELVYVKHPFFGNLEDEDGTFLASQIFAPLQQEVQLFIEEGGDQRLINQVEFYQWLENNYLEVYLAIHKYFEEDLRTANFQISTSALLEGFALEAIHIPASKICPTTEWEITYYEDQHAHHWFNVSMRGITVIGHSMDG